jgi:O-antigen/teichoic acid export membrane protein/O-antigen ligase
LLTAARRLPRLPWRAVRSLRAWTPGLRLSTVAATVGARVGASVFSFGASIIAARVLGPHGRGLLAVLIAVPGVIGILGLLGLDTANLRFAGLSHSAFRQVVRRAVMFSLAVGTAMGAAWWLAGSLWLPLRLGLDPRLALLCAALCPASLLLTLLATAEVGRGRTAVYNLVTAVSMALYLAGVVVLQLGGHLTVVACFAAYGASQLLGIAALLGLTAKRVHADGECVPLRQYSGYALRAYLPNVVQYGMLRMDVPIIQVLAGTTAVALYAVALPFAEALLLLPVTVGLVLFPQVTSGTVDRAAASRVGATVLAATAALAVAIAVAIPAIVPHLYGPAYNGSVGVIWCMLPGLVIFSAARTTQTYLAGTDNLRPVVVASLAGVAAGLVSLLALVARFGAVGAGIADSAGYAAFAMIILGGQHMKRPLADAVKSPLRSISHRASRVARRAVAEFSNVRPTVFGFVAAALALAGAALSTRDTTTTTVVLGILLLLIIVATPDTGLYVLAITIPVSQTSFGITLITDKDLLVLIIACVAGRAGARRVTPPRARAAALGVALICYFLVSTTLVGGGNASSQNLRGLLILSAVLLSLSLIARTDVTSRRAAVVFAFSAACVALVEIPTARSSLAASGNISTANSAAVAAGQTGALNHNTEGAFFVLALCVLLTLYSRTRKGIARFAVAAAIAVLVAGVAYSFSRSSYLGALAVLAVFAARRSVRGLLVAAVAVGCLIPVLPPAISARIGTLWAGSGLDISSVTRLDLWSSALRMFAHQPALGVGYLHFSSQLPAYFQSTSRSDPTTLSFSGFEYAHNTYLTVLSQTGLIGAVLVGTLIVAGWRRAWSTMRAGDWTGESAVLAFVGIGVCSVFGEPLFESAVLAAFMLIVLAAEPAERVRDSRLGVHDARVIDDIEASSNMRAASNA